MNYLTYREGKRRGTFGFPIELHYVAPGHPRYDMPLHWHMEYELILILEGSFSLNLDAESILLHAGDIVLVQEGIIHGGTPHECVYECIVFDLNKFLQENSACHAAFDNVLSHAQLQALLPKGSSACQIADAMFECMEKEQPGYEFIATGLLWQLTGTILRLHLYTDNSEIERKNRKRVRQIKRALARIRNDYAQDLTLCELAAEADMAPRYFCRAFAEFTGRTPIDCLNYYRIECAAERLLVTDSSVTDIALECGFNDLSYFARSFKKYKNISATEYRNTSV